MQLGQIDTNTIEGRLLIAAIIALSGYRIEEEPLKEIPVIHSDVMDYLTNKQAEIYKDAPPIPEPGPAPDFRESIRLAINSNNKEAGSDTPNIILTEYLIKCLEAFDIATMARDKYYLPS